MLERFLRHVLMFQKMVKDSIDILFASGLNSPVLGGNEVYVGAVHEKFDAEGNLTDESTIAFIDSVIANFQEWMKLYV